MQSITCRREQVYVVYCCPEKELQSCVLSESQDQPRQSPTGRAPRAQQVVLRVLQAQRAILSFREWWELCGNLSSQVPAKGSHCKQGFLRRACTGLCNPLLPKPCSQIQNDFPKRDVRNSVISHTCIYRPVSPAPGRHQAPGVRAPLSATCIW